MPKLRNQGEHGKPTYNQAQKIIQRFGGEAKLAKLIGISRISVYRWQYKRPIGADGLIPTANIEKIKAVARNEGILLRPEDWVPEVVKYDDQAQPITKLTRQPRTVADLLA
jgi:DNA-binding transcriptional regulator YdaS (Cro superfamily)